MIWLPERIKDLGLYPPDTPKGMLGDCHRQESLKDEAENPSKWRIIQAYRVRPTSPNRKNRCFSREKAGR